MTSLLARTFAAALALWLVTADAGASGPFIEEEGKGIAQIYGGSIRADNYYNTEGVQRQYDTVKTAFSIVMLGVTADYGIADGLELNLDVPVGIFTLTSRERFPDRQIVTPVYYGIGGTYQLSDGNLASSLSAMLKIPPGFHRGIYDDPEHPTFLSDGYLQVATMFNAGFRHKNVWLKGGIGYTWRDEEPLDEIPFSLEVGLTRVEGTGIFVGFNGIISTGDVTQPLRPFYAGASGTAEERERGDGGRGIFRTIDREDFLTVNAGAFVEILERYRISGRYELKLFGRNSIATRGALIGIGYRF